MDIENIKNSENFSNTGSIRFDILRPGGNNTALVRGIITDPEKRKKINDQIMKFYPNVEQVGFINLQENPELVMAGGEFCGNATRSTIWLALNGNAGEIMIQVSGVTSQLRAGITSNGEAYSQMPVYENPEKIQKDSDPTNFIVEMEGITHLIRFCADEIKDLSVEDTKKAAMALIIEKKLDQCPAAGIIYTEKSDEGWKIIPVVYVRDINTLFYETACGSGTAALGLVLAKQQGKSIKDVSIQQPSGLSIKISVNFNGEKFIDAQISGPITPLQEGILKETCGKTLVIEKIKTSQQLSANLFGNGLISLYQNIFSAPPYFENFYEEKVAEIFKEYLEKGVLFLARTEDEIVGFGAALPLTADQELSNLAIQFGIDPEKTWYMADLGVSPGYRRKGLAEELVLARLTSFERGFSVLMRTSRQNFASQSLYRKLLFKQVNGMKQEVEQKRTDGQIRKDGRIFFVKEVE